MYCISESLDTDTATVLWVYPNKWVFSEALCINTLLF